MATRPSRTPKRRRSRLRRWSVLGLRLGLVAAVLAALALVVAVYTARSSLPSFAALQSSPNGQMIRVRAADGTILVSLGPSYGEWLRYRDIPPVMIDAMVAVEDRRFRSHPGVDPVGVARSVKLAWDRRGTGRRLQGASTITQQVARTIFLSNDYSFSRKIREAILALALERKFSKDQILELYLNKVYFGGGAYGIDAASRRFFGHSADTLSLPEAAVVAGLVKAPSRYSPTADAEAAVERASVVLDVMADAGAITATQAAEAALEPVELAPEPRQNSVRYFTDWALPQLELLIDETLEPIDVWTTIDLDKQRAADAAIRTQTPRGAQGALVSLDRDGAVLALVGGRDYVSSIYNRATQAERQPGSAWKLFVYLAALEAGYRPDDRVVDEAVTIGGWSPRNSSGRFSGEIDMRSAFAYSINTVAAKLGADVGFGTVADMARRFGVTTTISTRPAMVLGSSEVRLIDMVRAFASVGANGVAVSPYGIRRVATTDGRLLYEHEADTSRVLIAPYVAAEITDLLQSAVATGTGRAADIGRPVAGKTGTTSSNKDGWFLGFSSGITTGVWMGRDDAKPVGGLQGGRAPAQAFASYMRRAVADRPVEPFETEVTLPEWQLEPDQEAYFGEPDEWFVDADGNPVEPPAGYRGRVVVEEPQEDIEQDADGEDRFDQSWLDSVLGRVPEPARRDRSGAPPPQQRPAPTRPANRDTYPPAPITERSTLRTPPAGYRTAPPIDRPTPPRTPGATRDGYRTAPPLDGSEEPRPTP